MKKTVLIILAAAGILLSGFGLWYGAGYLLSQKMVRSPVMPQSVELEKAPSVTVGAIIALRAEFTLPRYRKVLTAGMTPGKGSALSQAPVISTVRHGWEENVYQVQASLCALRPGESGAGEIQLEVTPARKDEAPERFTLKIPPFKIEALPLPGGTAPEIASALAAPQPRSRYWHLLWTLLLLIPLLFLLLRRKDQGAVKAVSLRTRTLAALESLRKEVLSHNRSAREGIAGISDLLRNYLEERYALPASGKTTPEFLNEIEFNALLPAKAGIFLRNFLNAADMIKFAKAPCDGSAVAAAVENAVELVENTSDDKEEEK